MGTLGGLSQGGILVAQFVLLGELANDFIEYSICLDPKSNCTSFINIEEAMIPFAYYFVVFAVAMAIALALTSVMWGVTAERQVHAMRKAFFRSILCQEMAWFDINDSGKLNSRLSEYVRL